MGSGAGGCTGGVGCSGAVSCTTGVGRATGVDSTTATGTFSTGVCTALLAGAGFVGVTGARSVFATRGVMCALLGTGSTKRVIGVSASIWYTTLRVICSAGVDCKAIHKIPR